MTDNPRITKALEIIAQKLTVIANKLTIIANAMPQVTPLAQQMEQEDRAAQQRHLARARTTEHPFDHNGECRFCDEMGEHADDCPWVQVRTPGCDCDQTGNTDVAMHANDCNWRAAVVLADMVDAHLANTTPDPARTERIRSIFEAKRQAESHEPGCDLHHGGTACSCSPYREDR